jgi:hypothetical protein
MALVWLNTNITRNFKIGMMSDHEFVTKFKACVLKGEQNEFSQFVRRKRPSIPGWARLRRAVFERDNFTCVYCGATNRPLHCDHAIPVSHGGSNDKSNLATACQDCNTSKHARPVEEWLRGR